MHCDDRNGSQAKVRIGNFKNKRQYLTVKIKLEEKRAERICNKGIGRLVKLKLKSYLKKGTLSILYASRESTLYVDSKYIKSTKHKEYGGVRGLNPNPKVWSYS